MTVQDNEPPIDAASDWALQAFARLVNHHSDDTTVSMTLSPGAGSWRGI